MHILLTGANGYIGGRLLPLLLEQGHRVTCLVRDKRRFHAPENRGMQVSVLEADLAQPEPPAALPRDIDVAYYLVHSMGGGGDFGREEEKTATHFVQWLKDMEGPQVIYLTGIAADQQLSKHLQSRQRVEEIVIKSGLPYTILRAAIIVGSGSASFEIIRDLVEKLPVMVAPRWLHTRCQPIAIRDVLYYLTAVTGRADCMKRVFDIAGPDVLTYKEMLLGYAAVRGLKRYILTVPVFSPRLSSYWLVFVTSVNYRIARSLVDSMRNEVIKGDNAIDSVLPHTCVSYTRALQLAFIKIEQNAIVSSWTDALNRGYLETSFMNQVEVPAKGVLTYRVSLPVAPGTRQNILQNIWAVGGARGWYHLNWLWALRGAIDTLAGGVGLRRGRRAAGIPRPGDSIDFWRVLLADPAHGRLLLYAEMKLPGEAWLEFKLDGEQNQYLQTATFRPLGLWGRLYWYAMWPFHLFIFGGMARKMVHQGNAVPGSGKSAEH